MTPEERRAADEKSIIKTQTQHLYMDARNNQEEEIREKEVEINNLQDKLQRTPEWHAIQQAKNELKPLKDNLSKTNSELTLGNRFFT